MRLGIDVGSTTVKLVLLDEENQIVYSKYERHMSNVFAKVQEMLEAMKAFMIEQGIGDIMMRSCITGSGGLSLSKLLEVPFEQEVITCSEAVERLIPETDVAIELGGEDAKITFYDQTIEQRMNGTCAGGTGAFIDQMAVLLNTDAGGLNEAARDYKVIYPIAARCGVFAKTDVQPLINEGAAVADIAVSIFQAVVNQTISGLACGRTIKGNVAFLGGPLSFLPELRKRFIETLELTPEQVIFPEDGKFFVAIGAAMLAEKYGEHGIDELIQHFENASVDDLNETKYIDPLFVDEADYAEFKARHDLDKMKRKPLSEASGPVYLGIDAGSTTTKAALIDADKNLLYDFYVSNQGKPIEATIEMLRDLYDKMPDSAYIAKSGVTGYGEALLISAFKVDTGEIETMAHYKAAEQFLPGVDFILDIGGQDMKCMKIRDGAIYSIMLNEACSSGCGSFIETYAKSVDMSVPDFSKEALFAKQPVDLGTRCTVFMNSKVKQAQKEGATIGDISAGLSYSVIRNALYKVIKMRNPEEAGERIVVQGGTFLNDAILRSFERIMGRDVVRPDMAGIMGAFGAALVAMSKDDGKGSTLYNREQLDSFSMENTFARCNGCENHCMLTINKFSDGTRHISGNRCEKGEGKGNVNADLPNMYQYKLKRVFEYDALPETSASRGVIGIPRVLNMFEDYPFWHTFLTSLGFSVKLSPISTKKMYESGMDTISSDTACYPAKIVHGHIKSLVNDGIKRIFYPNINYEYVEDKTAPNHYNCPIVATYPEVIANNMDDIFKDNDVTFMHPFLPYDDDERLLREALAAFKGFNISESDMKSAIAAARAEQLAFKKEIQDKGEEYIDWARAHGKKIIILSGRPYHLDPEINHGIDKLIAGFDMVVLSEDSVSHLGNLPRPIRVLDQWVYHSRLYKAAEFAGHHDDIEIIQLNSFGCGVDAVTTDEVEEITSMNNKLYTVLKIDEGNNLGAARIRIRSLKAAIEERERNGVKPNLNEAPYERAIYTKEMAASGYTILMPQMAPIHFNFIEAAIRHAGHNAVLLPPVDKNAVEEGLKYINNDICYPTIVALGQVISALKSGKYDLDKTAVFMTQTGGQCRASNYVGLLRKALRDMGLGHIPVISLNMSKLESNPGFNLADPKLLVGAVMGAVYGDVLMRILYRTRPYEIVPGSADALAEKWTKIGCKSLEKRKWSEYKKVIRGMINDFDNLAIDEEMRKPKVGVVGEILVKYHPNANNDIVGIIESEGGEAVVPDLIDFMYYCAYSRTFNYEHLSGSKKSMKLANLLMWFMDQLRKPAISALKASKRFDAPNNILETAEKATQVASLGSQCGEGWLLTGEMMELIDSGCPNIVCLQPFACLPNHVTGKGMMKAMRKHSPLANIVAIDFDPGASDVNQLNRIKLMMATAHKNLRNEMASEMEYLDSEAAE